MQTRALSAPSVAPRDANWSRIATIAVLVGVLATYLISFGFRDPGYSLAIDGLLGNAVLALPAIVCLVRAAVIPAQRLAFALIGLAATAFTAGNLTYIFHVQFLSPVPYPSTADIGYLLPYPLLLIAVVALARSQLRGLAAGALLDGLLGALSCAAAGSIVTLHPLLNNLQGSTAAVIVGGTYPVADLTLAALIVAVVIMRGRRPGATWLWLGSGMIIFAVADTVYLYRVTMDSYEVGTPLDGLWAVGLNLMAIAATLPYRRGSHPPVPSSSEALVLPSVFSLIGIGILIYGSLFDHGLPVYAVVLTAMTLLTALRRTALGFSALRQLAVSRRQARTDELTQLPNRRYFDEHVQRILAERSDGENLAVLMFDLNDFNAVNKTFGHHAGDELLRQIGPRLRRELRDGDVLARLGGDEFALLLLGCDRVTAAIVADRLMSTIGMPFLIDGELQTASASLGIAMCPEDGVDLAVLLQRADAAMHGAKADRNGITVYSAIRHSDPQDRLSAREALSRHELVLAYQPQFDLRSGRMVGVEALVRWQHPVRGLLMPDSFLPFFEQASLMAELTLRVLELGAAQIRQWQLTGVDLNLSINLAPSALLRADLIDSIGDTLTGQSLAPSSLTVEITESAMMLDIDRARRALTELRALGVKLSLDDYGTGYCSLTYLRDLPLDEVKIDRSFVMNLVPGSIDAAIVASTVDLARTLGLRTVAEGVENPEVLRFVSDLGCDIGQGYLLGRPVAPDQLLVGATQAAQNV